MAALPLAGLRVVEIGSGDALEFCGKMFADFGAEVLKVEPQDGDAGRREPPLAAIGNGRSESAAFAWRNTNKRSIAADAASHDGAAFVATLLADADLLLDGRPPDAWRDGPLAHDGLRAAQPGLGITTLSPFGPHGLYRDFHVTDAVLRSLAGLVKLIGPAEGPPVLPRDGQIAVVAGMSAFIPSLAAIYGRAHGARRYDVSAFAAMLQISEFDTGLGLESGFTRPRVGLNRFGRGYPSGCLETKHGWLGVTVVTPSQWQAFTAMIGLPELGLDPRYAAALDRFVHADTLGAIIKPVLLQQTAQHWFDEGIARRIPLALVPDMAELLTLPVFRARGAFAKVQIGDAAFDGPVLPQRLLKTPPKPNGRAPLSGECDAATLTPHIRKATRNATATDALPLDGVTIVDLTMGWAGPTATRQMADLGADVLKIESCAYPDWFRGTDPRPPYHAERTYEKALWFQIMNRNKRGITLDLTDERGLALLRKLIAEADAVIDNYAADVMPRLGLGAASLLRLDPRLVVVTMPAFGMDNAWSGVRAYGSTLEQASGLPSVNGRDGDPPTMLHTALGDPVGGLNAAAALLLALLHRQKTGEGQHVDLSATEALLPMLAPSIVAQAATGDAGPRRGNRHPRFVPHGCFPCLGEDQWVTLAVRSDAQWQALCAAMRRDDLAADPALADADGRRANEDRIEVAIRQWTATVRPDIAMMALQTAGIAAGIARTPMDLAGDPHLVSVGHWQPAMRRFIGPHLLPAPPYREDGAVLPRPLRLLAPTLGEHNADILRGRLGLGDAAIAALAADGVIGDTATQKPAGKAEKETHVTKDTCAGAAAAASDTARKAG